MSFGTFGLFNFFQQPKTGKTPEPNSLTNEQIAAITAGTNHGGAVADFNWPFPYVLTNTPAIIISNKASPRLALFSDSYLGLRPAKINSDFSGSFYKDYEYANISSDFRGVIWPNVDGTNVIQFNYSGNVTGSQFDNTQDYIVISGEITGSKPDFFNKYFVFSGDFVSGNPDINLLNTTISGYFSGSQFDQTNIYSSLSGSFYPVNQDKTNILYNLYSFSVKYNTEVLQLSGQDDCNIYYNLYGFSVSQRL